MIQLANHHRLQIRITNWVVSIPGRDEPISPLKETKSNWYVTDEVCLHKSCMVVIFEDIQGQCSTWEEYGEGELETDRPEAEA